MRLGEQCGRRAAGGEAAAANVPEHGPDARRIAPRRGCAAICRAGVGGPRPAPAQFPPPPHPRLRLRPETESRVAVNPAEQIVDWLREAAAPLSGQELARRLGCTRAAVWKHIAALRQAGYEIRGRRSSGYLLAAVPDRLRPAARAPPPGGSRRGAARAAGPRARPHTAAR